MAILQHKPNRPEDAVTKLTPMIAKMALKYARNHRGRDFDDLMQDGYEGLMKAYHSFDPSKNRAFSSHAYQWIWAHIKDRAVKKWIDYNNTSGKSYEEHDLGAYSMPVEVKIDHDRILGKLDAKSKAIVAARRQGYTFRDISEALGKLGYNVSLHQVRNIYLDAIGE